MLEAARRRSTTRYRVPHLCLPHETIGVPFVGGCLNLWTILGMAL